MRRFLFLVGLFAPAFAYGQTVSSVTQPNQYEYLFQASGAWSQVLPTSPTGGNISVLVRACAGGGAGGGGQNSASTAGGGGGSGGSCIDWITLTAASGATLSGTVGAGGTLAGTGSTGGDGFNTTITGYLGGDTITLPPGKGGLAGSAGTGGTSGASPFSATGAGGNAGAAGAGSGTCAFANQANYNNTTMPRGWWDGCTGSGGGATAGLPGNGGTYRLINIATRTASNGAGGTGGDSFFSRGQVGAAQGASCSASPTWVGLGGAGGCGGGSTGSSGPGQAGFVELLVRVN